MVDSTAEEEEDEVEKEEVVEGAAIEESPLLPVESFFADFPFANPLPFVSLTFGVTSGLTSAFEEENEATFEVVSSLISNFGILAGEGVTILFLKTKFFAGEGAEEETLMFEEVAVVDVAAFLVGVGFVFLVVVGVGVVFGVVIGVVFGVVLVSTSIGSSASSSSLGGEAAKADLSTPSSA